MTNETTIRMRASDAEPKLRNDAKAGNVSLRKWTQFKREYPHGTMSDYKAIQKREKEIEATNKTVFGASEKPVEKTEKKAKTATPPQAKQMLGAAPDQQDDLLCANQQWFDHSPNPPASGERMLDPSGVRRERRRIHRRRCLARLLALRESWR